MHPNNNSFHKLKQILGNLKVTYDCGFVMHECQSNEDIHEIVNEANLCLKKLALHLSQAPKPRRFKKNKDETKIVIAEDFYSYLIKWIDQMLIEFQQPMSSSRYRKTVVQKSKVPKVIPTSVQDLPQEPIREQACVAQSQPQQIDELEKINAQINQELPDAWNPASPNYYKATLKLFDKRKLADSLVDFLQESAVIYKARKIN